MNLDEKINLIDEEICKLVETCDLDESVISMIAINLNVGEKYFLNKLKKITQDYRDNIFMNKESKDYNDNSKFDDVEKLIELIKSKYYLLKDSLPSTEDEEIEVEKETTKQLVNNIVATLPEITTETVDSQESCVPAQLEELIDEAINEDPPEIKYSDKLNKLDEAANNWKDKIDRLFLDQILNYTADMKVFNDKYKNEMFMTAEIRAEKEHILKKYSPVIYDLTADVLHELVNKHIADVKRLAIENIETINIDLLIELEFDLYHLDLINKRV